MGTVFRKTATKPLPDGAQIITRKGQKLAQWHDRRGKRRTAPLTFSKSGDERIVVTASTYTAKYRDGSGIVREVATGCRDEAAARAVLSQLERRAELVKADVLTAAEDAVIDHQATPLENHVEAYITHLRAKGLNSTRIDNSRSRLHRISAEMSLSRLSDVSEPKLETWLLRRERDGMSAGARNGYREAWIGFGNWCVRTGRFLKNPLAKLPQGGRQGRLSSSTAGIAGR